MILHLFLDLNQLWVRGPPQVGLVLLAIEGDLVRLPIELAKNLLVEQLLPVKRMFGPEGADVLLRDRGTPGEIPHHAPVLLPVCRWLALCLTREHFDCAVDFVLEEIVQVASFRRVLHRGEGRCLQHPLVQTLVEDVELPRTLSEGHLHWVILARCVLSEIPLGIQVGLLPLGDVFGLLLAGQLDGDLEDAAEVIQIDVVLARQHGMGLEQDVHVLLLDPICDIHDVVSEPLLGDPGKIHPAGLNEHVEDHVDALHLREGELLSNAPDHLPLSELAHYVGLAATADHVGR